MRLQLKYTLIINICILLIIVTFFVIDDFLARHERKVSHINDLARGAIIRNVATLVKEIVEAQVYINYRSEKEENEGFPSKQIEIELKKLKKENLEMKDIVDINVSYGDSNQISASLTDKKNEGPFYINLNEKDIKKIIQEGNIYIYGLGKYHEKSVTEIIVPYHYFENSEDRISGLIQILLATPEVPKYFHNLRIRRLIYIIILGLLFTFIVNILTDRIVIRPLEKLMKTIRDASEGKFDLKIHSYSGSEIDQVTFRLSQLLRKIKTGHEKRIAALGQLTAGVAHDLKNPLNVIGMTTQYLKDLLSNGQVNERNIDDIQECLEDISYEVEDIRKLIDQFISLNRPKSLEIEKVNLEELIEQTINRSKLLKKNSNVKVFTEYSGELKNVELDPNQIRQVLQNLIQNSIQAMPKGGKIYITTNRLKKIDGDYASITIRDTGIGIPEVIQERIYDAYFTTKENQGGTGLGLAITHKIVQAHKGEIELKSKEGMGASFTIFLPIKRSFR